MEHSFENTDELIAKALAGEASPQEVAQLDAWKRASQENAAWFTQSEKLFTTLNTLKITQPVDTAAAWNKLNQRLEAPAAKVIPISRRTFYIRAAAVIMLVALGVLIKFLISDTATAPVVLAATEKSVQQTLPDGSKVFINKHTELSYTLNNNKVRRVTLKGEAFFEVVHNAEQPFEISINDVVIKDIGTAFNVKAIPGSNTIEVLVESGEVQFYTSENKGLNLVKGEKALYDLGSKQFVKSTVNPSENTGSYKSKLFHFEENTLAEILKQINDVYGSDIKISNEKLASCRLSVDFNNESVNVMVSVIAETLDLEVEHSGNAVILKGSACAD